MNERRKIAIDALRGISSGEKDEKERNMYMEAINILLNPEDNLLSDAFCCDKCSKNKVTDGENICLAGCLTAADCKKKFQRIQKNMEEYKKCRK